MLEYELVKNPGHLREPGSEEHVQGGMDMESPGTRAVINKHGSSFIHLTYANFTSIVCNHKAEVSYYHYSLT